MSESKAYDLVVIGSGTAAQVVSFRVRAAGWSVAVIDHLPFGGTCALRGCDPKKMLISGAEAIDMARRMRGRGVTGELGISWPELIAFKRTFTDPVPANHELITKHQTKRSTGLGIPAVEVEQLVTSRVRQWLLDPGNIYQATQLPDLSAQRQLVAGAAEIGKSWPELPGTRQRAVLTRLIERIDVGAFCCICWRWKTRVTAMAGRAWLTMFAFHCARIG